MENKNQYETPELKMFELETSMIMQGSPSAEEEG